MRCATCRAAHARQGRRRATNPRARSRRWPRKRRDRLHCVLVAHLRDEKDPRTVFDAWRRLPARVPATLTIIGAALDPALGRRRARARRATIRACSVLGRAAARVDAAGDQARARARSCRRAWKAAPTSSSRRSPPAPPVLASRMSGNVGMLGRRLSRLFRASATPAALAALVARACARSRVPRARSTAHARARARACSRRRPSGRRSLALSSDARRATPPVEWPPVSTRRENSP